jgi:hypothetical protein
MPAGEENAVMDPIFLRGCQISRKRQLKQKIVKCFS